MNINDKVRVKLTAHGRAMLYANHARLDVISLSKEFPPYEPPKEVDGWSTWQLWTLMQEFGPHLYNGCIMPFECEIEIVKDDVSREFVGTTSV